MTKATNGEVEFRINRALFERDITQLFREISTFMRSEGLEATWSELADIPTRQTSKPDHLKVVK